MSEPETARKSSQTRAWLRRLAPAFRGRLRYSVTRSGYLFGSALVIVGAAAVASANNLLFLIMAAMLATAMISGVVSRLCLAGLELELALPEHIAARQSANARFKLRNFKWFPSFALQLSSQTTERKILAKPIIFPSLPARTAVEADAPVSFPCRGVHRESLFVLGTRFPFGLVERRAFISIRSEVVVYPSLQPTPLTASLLATLRGELERDRRGMGADFYRLRPYELHENARYVDWRSSAHTGELQVREFASEERSTVYVFLDLRAPAGNEFERAVECCAFLLWTLSADSVRVRFRTQRADLVCPDQVDIYGILNELALVEPDPRAPSPAPGGPDPQVLFSAAPHDCESAGCWTPDRIIPIAAISVDEV